jgi:hypothetical protein
MSFGNLATPVFIDEPCDKSGLKQEKRNYCENWCAVLVPYAQIAELNFASGWQTRLANSLPLHLTPIEQNLVIGDFHQM